MAMNQCLNVAEIVELIATYAAQDGNPKRLRPQASLALTCRAFYEPACNVVWRNLRSFQPLLKLFVMKRTSATVTGPVSLEEFTNASDPESWDRFMHHARRVRKLDCQWTWYQLAYLKVLQEHRPSKEDPLLPGLRHFTYTFPGQTSDSLLPLQAFVHSGLWSLRIFCVSRHDAASIPSFDFLIDKLPLLRNLDIRFFSLDSERLTSVFRSIDRLLPTFDNLTSIIWNKEPLSPSVLLHLGQLRLKSLNVYINSTSTSVLPKTARAIEEKALFPALQRLWLISAVATDVTDFLRSLTTTKLKTVQLLLHEQPLAATMLDWTTCLATQRSFSQFDVGVPHPIWEELWHGAPELSAEYQIDDDVIRPLLSLNTMTRFIIRDTPMKLTDELAHDMATSWPALRELILGIQVLGQTTGITLDGLKSFSMNTPKLWLLAVSVDMPPAADPPQAPRRKWLRVNKARPRESGLDSSAHLIPTSELASQGIVDDDISSKACCTRLKTIAVGNAEVPNPLAVASFVSENFPDVRNVTAGIWYIDWEESKKLGKVNKMIRKTGKPRWGATADQFGFRLFHISRYLSFPGRDPFDDDLLGV